MKVDVYVLCKNEAKLAPFFIDYWKALAEDVDVYVYDGKSTDGCIEIFGKYGFIHVIDGINDCVDDRKYLSIKNNEWKKSRGVADFVMVCDFDETIFSYSMLELRDNLEYMKENGYTILAPLSFNLVSDNFPEYHDGKYLHEIVNTGYNDYTCYAKPILFNPNKIEEINYILGAHCARPSGDVKWYCPDDMFMIHAKYLGVDNYIKRIRRRELSEFNRQIGIFAEQEHSDNELICTFSEAKGKCFEWNLIKENFDIYYKIKHDWTPWGMGKL